MVDFWKFQDQGGNEYEIDVDTAGGFAKYLSQNPSAAPKFRMGGPADPAVARARSGSHSFSGSPSAENRLALEQELAAGGVWQGPTLPGTRTAEERKGSFDPNSERRMSYGPPSWGDIGGGLAAAGGAVAAGANWVGGDRGNVPVPPPTPMDPRWEGPVLPGEKTAAERNFDIQGIPPWEQYTDPQSYRRFGDAGYNWTEDVSFNQEGFGSKPMGLPWKDRRGPEFANPDAFATYAERVQFPDDPTGQRYDLSRDYAQETGGYSPGYATSRANVPVEGQVKQYGGYGQTPGGEEAFEVNPDFDTARTGGRYGAQPAMTALTQGEYDVAAAGGTNAAPVATTKNLEVNNAVTNAFMDPNPQNGINVMLDLLKGTLQPDGSYKELDEGSKQALLANIGQLYTAMQTSNPFGYTADTFAQEAVLDRASQENVARGGMTQDQALTQQSLDRQMQETIARGGLTARQAALQRELDNQYRTGQLTNEEAAIAANRYASEQQKAGMTGSAALQGAATQFAATEAAGAQRDSAEFAANAVTAAAESARLGAKEVAGIQKFSEILQLQGHERMAALANTSAEEIADIERRAAYDVAGANGVSAEAVAAINAGGAEQVAIQQGWSAQQVGDIQRQMHAAVADMTNLTETSVANTMAAAQRYAAEQQAAAQMGAANPFGLSSQQFLDMQGEQARGGLTVEERLGEISAANEPERLAALLGALAPGVQGSLQGFGMTAPPTVPTISNLRNTSAERQQYIEGLFGSFGVSPSMLANLVKSVSPGSPFGASTFA